MGSAHFKYGHPRIHALATTAFRIITNSILSLLRGNIGKFQNVHDLPMLFKNLLPIILLIGIGVMTMIFFELCMMFCKPTVWITHTKLM